ncbi:MAG: hypothetical protein H0U23_06295 [Blastocatellia bacterium]|nr:hypothetical protein [Blastocatellia bacterium]
MKNWPKRVTIDWLKRPNKKCDGVPNAHAVVEAGLTDRIPSNILCEFLAITDDDGITTLHNICRYEEPLKSVKQFLTPELLTKETSGQLLTGTPLEWAFRSEQQDNLPWERFNARRWVPHLPLLEKIKAGLVRNNGGKHGELDDLIRRVKKLRTLKKDSGIEQ